MKNQNEDLQNSVTYEAPKCEIIEMQNEGVLCGSASQATHDPFDESGNYEW